MEAELDEPGAVCSQEMQFAGLPQQGGGQQEEQQQQERVGGAESEGSLAAEEAAAAEPGAAGSEAPIALPLEVGLNLERVVAGG